MDIIFSITGAWFHMSREAKARAEELFDIQHLTICVRTNDKLENDGKFS